MIYALQPLSWHHQYAVLLFFMCYKDNRAGMLTLPRFRTKGKITVYLAQNIAKSVYTGDFVG